MTLPTAPAGDPGPRREPLPAAAPGARAGALATCLATLCGVGRFPVAPGTAGSLATLPLWWASSRAGGAWGPLALGALMAIAGMWAAGRVAAERGVTDPSEIVVDEAAGMLLSLAFLPPGWKFVAAGFFLFRALDVIKLWPAGPAERLPGGLGVVADDLVCAVYTNALLQLAAAWARS